MLDHWESDAIKIPFTNLRTLVYPLIFINFEHQFQYLKLNAQFTI